MLARSWRPLSAAVPPLQHTLLRSRRPLSAAVPPLQLTLLQRVPGVVATCSGYAQGHVDQPTYEQVRQACAKLVTHCQHAAVCFFACGAEVSLAWLPAPLVARRCAAGGRGTPRRCN